MYKLNQVTAQMKWSFTTHAPEDISQILRPPPHFKSSPDPERNTPEASAATKDKSSNDLFLAIPVHVM